MTSGLEIDHVFVCVSSGAPEAGRLAREGLREAYRRSHPGQGTANVCYAFDNAYLELLWGEDWDEIGSLAISRTRLAERAAWQSYRASPFGIALRGDDDRALPFATWDYAAPFLPEGETLPVALASEDPQQPFLFRAPPRCERPDRWRDMRGGARQRPIGLAEIIGVRLDFPPGVTPAPAIGALADAGLIELGLAGIGPRMTLTLSPTKPGPPRKLILPDFTFTD